MACPFAPKKASDNLTRQPSIADNAAWNLEDEISDVKDDSLSLSHLNSAIQLLTAPAVNNQFFGELSRKKAHYIFFIERRHSGSC